MTVTESTNTKIELSGEGVTWVHEQTGYSRAYIYEYIKNPTNWKGSSTAESKILDGIEAFRKHDAKKKKAISDKRLNALLSSTPHE